jgi:hypothetical protein
MKVSVGDMVKVVKVFESDCRILWIPEMDSTVGRTGLVLELYGDDDIYCVKLDNGEEYWYIDVSLEKI